MILPARLIRIITIIGTNKRQNPFGGLLNNQSFDFCTDLFWQLKKIHTKVTMQFLQEKTLCKILGENLYKFFCYVDNIFKLSKKFFSRT